MISNTQKLKCNVFLSAVSLLHMKTNRAKMPVSWKMKTPKNKSPSSGIRNPSSSSLTRLKFCCPNLPGKLGFS